MAIREGREDRGPAQEVRIAELDRADLAAAVEVHRASFAGDPVSLLGHEATRRYYLWLLDGPHASVAFSAHLGDRLVGVLVGGSFGSLFPGFLRRNLPFVLFTLATRPRLLAHPSIGGRIAGRLVPGGTASGGTEPSARTAFPAAEPPPGRAWELLAIAVSPEARGHGVGALLVDEATRRARATGYDRLELSVHPDNEGAIRFYERIGWSKLTSGDAWSGRMWRPASADPGTDEESGAS